MVTLDDKNLPRNRRTYKHQRKYSNLNFVIGHTTAGVTRISNKLTKCKKPNLKKKAPALLLQIIIILMTVKKI